MPQNSINAPTPIAVNKGGTGRSTPGPATPIYSFSGGDIMAPFNVYVCSGGSPLTFFLPLNSPLQLFDLFTVQGSWGNGFNFSIFCSDNSFQRITYNNDSVHGLTSPDPYAAITLICTNSANNDNIFSVQSATGTFTTIP